MLLVLSIIIYWVSVLPQEGFNPQLTKQQLLLSWSIKQVQHKIVVSPCRPLCQSPAAQAASCRPWTRSQRSSPPPRPTRRAGGRGTWAWEGGRRWVPSRQSLHPLFLKPKRGEALPSVNTIVKRASSSNIILKEVHRNIWDSKMSKM